MFDTTPIECPSAGAFGFTSLLDGRESWDEAALRAFFPDDSGPLREAVEASGERGLSYQVLLARGPGGASLVDSGNGWVDPARPGALAQALAERGVEPSDIDRIAITHFHSDHVGGLVGSSGEAAFPRAELHSSQAEWDFWTAYCGRREAEPWRRALQDAIDKGYRGRIFLHGSEAEIAPGIRLRPAPGHTRGHAIVEFGGSGGERLLHSGDLFHLSAQFRFPDRRTQYDQDPAGARESRLGLAREAAESGCLVFLNHAAFPGFGHVRAEGEAFRWDPLG